jgi:hypothetical protein
MAQIKLSKDSDRIPPELFVGTSVVGVPLMLTAVRCTFQYIIVPVILPLFGAHGAFSPVANMVAEFVGLAVVIYNVKRLWHTNWRTRYLWLSLVIVPFILFSLYFDYLAYLTF